MTAFTVTPSRPVAASGPRCSEKNGRGRGARTPDLRFWRPPLYQLSYTPKCLPRPKRTAHHRQGMASLRRGDGLGNPEEEFFSQLVPIVALSNHSPSPLLARRRSAECAGPVETSARGILERAAALWWITADLVERLKPHTASVGSPISRPSLAAAPFAGWPLGTFSLDW